MLCTTAAEMELIKMTDAGRYADPATLCSAACRQVLAWSDWEMAAAKATYELLRNLENVLRCTVSDRLSSHYQREDWWNAPRLRLTYSTMEKIENAEDKLRQAGVQVTPTAILREVPLGFWVTLLGRGHDYETQVWRPVSSGFPGYRGRRAPLHSRLDHLRLLRNKVAHQDRIGSRDLAADRRSTLIAIGYMSEAVARRVGAADTALPRLLMSRPGICAQRAGGTS
ncbi:hypothetical protein AB0N28_00365 [Streptomyces sp. NPDC051130]|uniref:hypothetical protein n=1 Tax=Streptomyces sp. NPDC051130 TaxID=3157223 RepID=UPI0034184031